MDKPPTGLTLQEVIEEFKKAPVRDYLSVEGVDREISDSKNWTNIRKDCIAYDISTTTRLREVTGSTKILDILKHIYIKELKPRDPNAPLDPCGIITWGFYLLSHDISPEAVEHVRQRIRKSNEYNKILIVTATPVETQAVLDVFKAGDSPAIIQNINGKLYYYLADCGDAQALLVT